MVRWLLVLALASCTFLLIRPVLAEDKVVVATIAGDIFHEQDFLEANVEPRFKLAYALNRFRPFAEARVVALRLPSCPLKAEEDEIHTYIEWWRRELERRGSAWLELGKRDERARKRAAEIEGARKSITIHNDRATSIATSEIETWMRYACIQEKYRGDRFFVPDGSFDRVAEDSTAVTSKNGLLLPFVARLPEPVTSIGRLFEAAEKDGQLAIATNERRDYFFARYETAKYGNRSADEVIEDLATPYWRRMR